MLTWIVVEQVSVNDAPILTLAFFGDIDPTVISQAAEDIQDRLERVAGVSEVSLGGAHKEVISVQMNPLRLATLGISPTYDVAKATLSEIKIILA